MYLQDEYNEQGRELREHGTAEFPAACYGGDWMLASVPLHWHSELEAGFVTSGQVLLIVGRERIVLQEGEGFFINSGIPHGFACSEAGSSMQRSVVFDPIVVGGRPDSVYWKRYVQPVLNCEAQPWCRLGGEEAWRVNALAGVRTSWEACSREEPDYELQAREGLTCLMVQLQKHLPLEQPARTRRIQRDNERIRIMMDFIQAHYQEPLTVHQIASSAVISVSEALRCFHNTVGMTPIQCANHYRIQKAAGALVHTDQKIMEIGMECGFQEMSYFAKTFRSIMGVTPSRYRRKFRKEDTLPERK